MSGGNSCIVFRSSAPVSCQDAAVTDERIVIVFGNDLRIVRKAYYVERSNPGRGIRHDSTGASAM